jgi:homoserine O-acetyltransferase
MHGTTGTGAAFLWPICWKSIWKRATLDATKYFIILTDDIDTVSHQNSSDGNENEVSKYNYDDMVLQTISY